MAFAGRVNISNGSYVDLFNGIADTGIYEVTVTDGGTGTHIVSSNVATEGVQCNFSTTFPAPLKFTWDSAQPLYVYASTTSQFIKYILTPLASVGLSVSC